VKEEPTVFTGIIEEVGRVAEIRKSQAQWILTVQTSDSFAGDIKAGDSIAVDGVCLTALETRANRFSAGVSRESLSRSTLHAFEGNRAVNLEKAVAVGGRLGGHVVLGHVDGVGRVETILGEGDSHRFHFSCPEEVSTYLVRKGSIAINGVSLTIASEAGKRFEVVVVPYTFEHTNLASLRTADAVNIECDIIAKYIEKYVGSGKGRALDEQFLEEHGFFKP
jgi:riboflavin synthase